MTRVQSFPPLARPDARILILGSMPGVRSLDANQYYAHPQNAFWRILGDIFGFDPALPYAERCQALMEHHIALWDVLRSCERPGSLDADIIEASIAPNDIGALLSAHPHIERICFNGAKAEQSFHRHVRPTLSGRTDTLRLARLPSTSPAHAGMCFEDKLTRWRCALAPSGS